MKSEVQSIYLPFKVWFLARTKKNVRVSHCLCVSIIYIYMYNVLYITPMYEHLSDLRLPTFQGVFFITKANNSNLYFKIITTNWDCLKLSTGKKNFHFHINSWGERLFYSEICISSTLRLFKVCRVGEVRKVQYDRIQKPEKNWHQFSVFKVRIPFYRLRHGEEQTTNSRE